MINRINSLRHERKITIQQIANESGKSRWAVTKQLQGTYKLDIDVLLAILNLCPDVSADWLLLGHGDQSRADLRTIYDKVRSIEDIVTKMNSNIAKT